MKLKQRLDKRKSSPTLAHTRFSKVNLLVFAIIFGAIGMYALFHSSAATTTANVFVSVNGSDSGANCKRFATASTNPDPGGTSLCLTWNKAYQVAQQGDSVEVEPGAYTPNNPMINVDASKTTNGSYVTFRCASSSAENVTINPVGGGTDPDFQMDDFIIGSHIKIDGGGNWRTSTPSCMRFHSIWTTQLGTSAIYGNDLVFTGIHMQTMEAFHSNNVTVSTSELGPSTGCENQEWSTASKRCQDIAATGEDWYYQNDLRNCGTETNSNIGEGVTSLIFDNNWFHDAQTRNAGPPGNCHNGAIETQGPANGVTFTRNRFEQNVVYDIFLEGDFTNVDVENNWMGTPVDSFENGCSYHTCLEIPGFFSLEVDNRNGHTNFVNWLVRFNTMSGNSRFTFPGNGPNTYTNVRWIGNLEAGFDCSNSSGMTVDYNAFVGSTCGTHGTNLSSLGVNVATGYPIDFNLSGAPHIPAVPNSGADYNSAIDYHGNPRNYPTAAGATEYASGSCAAKPSTCGYPDDTNTGLPTGTTLTPSGPLVIRTDGTVLNGLDINGVIDVYAKNVTIKNSRIITSGNSSAGIFIRAGATNTIIQDVTIHGLDTGANEMQYAVVDTGSGPTSITRANIYNCADCVQAQNVTLQDSYIHDMGYVNGDHTDGAQANGGSGFKALHNTIFNSWPQTSAIALFQDFAPQANDTIDNNLLAGGGYTIYGGQGPKAASNGIHITNNRFSRMYYPLGGGFGPVAYWEGTGVDNIWQNNVWDEDNAAIVEASNPAPPPSGSSSPPPTYKKGDCNHDGLVTLTDLSILLSHYGTNYSNADFNSDALVSLADLSILLSNYGK